MYVSPDLFDETIQISYTGAGSIAINYSWIMVVVGGINLRSFKATATTPTDFDIVFGGGGGPDSDKLQYFETTNIGSTDVVATVRKFDSTLTLGYPVFSVTLKPNESLSYNQDEGFVVRDKFLIKKTDYAVSAVNGKLFSFYKIGTAPEAIGVGYCFSKDSGFPGAFVIGTPGLAGRAIDSRLAADSGSFFINSSIGALKVSDDNVISTLSTVLQLVDFMWINTGIVVTTTTAQSLGTTALVPARDAEDGGTGVGVFPAILVTTATTNAAAITNMTISYTNSDGVSGRTATIPSFPATAVVGSFVEFRLQGKDTGVRSIQSVTLGTSLVSGAVSLVLFRKITNSFASVVNTPTVSSPIKSSKSGAIIKPGACLQLISYPSAATAHTVFGSYLIEEV